MKIAVVGMAFRLPGGICDEHSFWRVLSEGRDVVTEIPEGRWGKDYYGHPSRKEPGRSITWSAGVIEQQGAFDAAFFGISPREANNMDPQQRLLLELTWEALENGGQIPEKLAGSDCAVYLGISGTDYGLRSIDDLSTVDAYSMTGNTLSVAANRISYVFDFRGPSMAIDTACSSSVVALHQACRSLRDGEASAAVAGGVNMLLHPYPFIGFTKASMLSAGGRCRAFDASGDGYVRAEGAGVLFLKPLAQAERDGDPIHAVILASGVNSDGYKNGITIPSARGQSTLLQATCRQAGISPDDLVYVEAHGTGTAVGDPIETAAIGEAVGTKRRPESPPLYIGSVKTNLGHLESASGMAGLIKTVLCLKHRALPPSLHLTTPNPHIDFAALNLRVVQKLTPLAAGDRPARMGVNSFGFGGANGHVLLEEYVPPKAAGQVVSTLTPPLILSARSVPALRELAGRYADLLGEGGAHYDIAYAAAHKRQWLEHRLAVVGRTREESRERLRAFAQGSGGPGVVQQDALAEAGPVAFVYSGNGAQWLGMGRALLAEVPEFRRALQEVDALFQPLAGFSIIDELQADADASRLQLTQVAQPALFAIQVGVTQWLRAQGLRPAATMGHSVGEVAAAWAAGALSLEQAVRVIHERSAAQETTRGSGKMAAVSLSEADVRAELARLGLSEALEVAGINSPKGVTLSGDPADLERLRLVLKPRSIFFRVLDLDYAFHSRRMDGIEPMLLERLAGLAPTPGTARFISTVTGDEADGETLDARYWWRNVREPVRFAAAAGRLLDDGIRIFVEIGPHAIMQRYLGECLAAAGVSGRVLPTLKRDNDGPERLQEALYGALLAGARADLSRLFPHPGQPVALPAYPWQRERYWYALTSEGYDLVNRTRVHPLLGYRLKDAEAAWENHLDPRQLAYLQDHVVGGAVVFPASGYVEMALAASRAWFGGEHGHEIEALEIRAPIVFDGEHGRTVRFELSPADGGFQIRSRERLSGDDWRLHVVGRLLGQPLAPRPEAPFSAAELERTVWNVSADAHYRMAEDLGLRYGPAFRGVVACRAEGAGVIARLAAPEGILDGLSAHVLHPALLDACFQSLFDGFRDEVAAGGRVTLLPVGVGRLRFHAGGGDVAYCWSRLKKRGPRSAVAEFWLLDETGRPLAVLDDCRFRGAALARHGEHTPAAWRYHAIVKPGPADRVPLELPLCDDLASHAKAALIDQEVALRRSEHYQRFAPLFEALAGAFAWEAYQRLAPDGTLDADALAALAPEDGARRRVLDWVLDVLEQDGLVQRGAGGWRASQAEDLPAAQDIWLTLLGEGPSYVPELVLAGRAGSHLPGVLAGELDGEQLGRSLRASPLSEQWYEASPAYAGMQAGAKAILAHLAEIWPARRRMRILDISEGHGALARELLPLLPPERWDYVLVGTEEESVARMEAEFGHLPGVACALAGRDDLALPEAGDGLAAPFDVVLLGHVLHRAGDLRQALVRLRQRMAENGLLLLLERAPDALANLIFGLEPQWWRPGQAGGRVSSLMDAPRWAQLLGDCDFHDVVALREPAAGDLTLGAFALLAKAPAPEAALAPPAAATWALLADAAGEARDFADALAARLRQAGQRVWLARPEATPAGMARLVDEARAAMGGCDHVVHLLGLGAGEDDPLAAQDARCVSTLHLTHALEAGGPAARLWLVTRGGAVVTDPGGPRRPAFRNDPAQAALWGFGRVLMNEHPDLACVLVDLQADLDDALAGRLLAELTAPDGEDEVILARDGRFALRMSPFHPAVDKAAAGHGRLDFVMPGQLKNLHWRPLAERPLAADEIEIQPRAVGLNFRDVMYAMGLLSDEAVENGFAGASLGMELAGVVTRVGAQVEEFRVGDAVVAFAPACFASRVITKAGSAAPKPEAWSFEEAATVPTVFFTVYYALHYLARLQPGEKVLIHGAAGGVGIAAIQVARYLGAEIFATAGSDEKRDFVTLLGADHVMNSRTLAYADEIMGRTGGQGIDVVLNSLAGEAINRNFRILRPFGRFLELGKRDFYENTRIGLRPFKDNITYYGIDADQLMVERPALASSLFREVMDLFADGALRPLPYRAFPARRVVEAFRYMQASRQIGKVVVTFDDAPLPVSVAERPAAPPALAADGTYLVTGGVGGFGQRTARWLAEQGAGNLVLLSRRGADAPGAAEARAELEALGARVCLRACDVTDAGQVSALVAEIQATMPPLKGVVHAAMVLDDGLVRNLDRERFLRAMAPKVQGAWNLHRATQGLALDLFVLYSSATTFIGNPAQANYVAANLYLESLAAHRRARGLPATCVAWGAIADVGYLARNEEIKDALQSRLGGKALASQQALEQLGALLAADASGVAVIDFDWPTLQRFLPAARAPRFDELRRLGGQGAGEEGGGEDIRALLAGRTPEEAQALIRDLLLEEVAAILRLPKERIDIERSLYDLGMDSLMGVELVLGIEKRFGISLPVMALTEGPTIKRISERLATALLHGGEAGATQDPLTAVVSAVAAQHAVEASAEDLARAVETLREQTGGGAKP